MGPSMTSFLQSMRDGGPLGIMPSMASTNLQTGLAKALLYSLKRSVAATAQMLQLCRVLPSCL